LADQEAEAIPQSGLTIVRAIGDVRVFLLATSLRRIWRSGEPSQLFNGAKPDTVRLPQSAVDSSSFGNTHLGSPDQGGNVGGISIPIADETS
jgi:hypothetical protein